MTRRFGFYPIASLLAFALVGVSPLSLAGQNTIAIVGATIIDGNGGPPLVNGTIVLTGNRISTVGPAGTVDVPNGAQVIDGTGKFVTPGFIDSNVHLSLYGAGETIIRYEPRNADLALESAQLELKHGFTTVRDSYGSLLPLIEVRDAIKRGEVVGPRMLVAGNIVGWAVFNHLFSCSRNRPHAVSGAVQ